MTDNDTDIDVEETRDELTDAIEDIPDADPDSLALYDDGHGHFVINSDTDDQDVDDIDAALEEVGYERDGVLNPPGMTQQNIRPADQDGDGDAA